MRRERKCARQRRLVHARKAGSAVVQAVHGKPGVRGRAMRQRATAPISHASPALGKHTTATKVSATAEPTNQPPLSPFSYAHVEGDADLAAGESIRIIPGSRARGHTGQKGGLGFHVIKRLPLQALPWSNGGPVSGAPHRIRWRGCSRAGQDNPLVAMLARTCQTGGSDSVSTREIRRVAAAPACAGRPRCVLCNPLGKLSGQAMEQALQVRLGSADWVRVSASTSITVHLVRACNPAGSVVGSPRCHRMGPHLGRRPRQGGSRGRKAGRPAVP